MIEYLGGCGVAREVFAVPNTVHCCNSCHEDDDDFGIPMCHINMRSDESDGFYEVCCRVHDFVNKPKLEVVK